jgi:hypothetical protein
MKAVRGIVGSMPRVVLPLALGARAEVDDFFADDEDDWISDPRPTGVGVAPDADGYAFVAAIIIYDEQ